MEEDGSRCAGHALYSKCAVLSHVPLFGKNTDSLGGGENAICSHEVMEEGTAQIGFQEDESAYATEKNNAA